MCVDYYSLEDIHHDMHLLVYRSLQDPEGQIKFKRVMCGPPKSFPNAYQLLDLVRAYVLSTCFTHVTRRFVGTPKNRFAVESVLFTLSAEFTAT